MDFGRITVDDSLILYLFGTPGPGPLLVHVGRAGPRLRSARSCSSTCAGSTTASPPSTTSRTAGCRSSSRSTASPRPTRFADRRGPRRARAERGHPGRADGRPRVGTGLKTLVTLVEHALEREPPRALTIVHCALAESAACVFSARRRRGWRLAAPPRLGVRRAHRLGRLRLRLRRPPARRRRRRPGVAHAAGARRHGHPVACPRAVQHPGVDLPRARPRRRRRDRAPGELGGRGHRGRHRLPPPAAGIRSHRPVRAPGTRRAPSRCAS